MAVDGDKEKRSSRKREREILSQPLDGGAAAPVKKRGRPPKDPSLGAMAGKERAAQSRQRVREEQERNGQHVERLVRSFAAAVFYLAENDPTQARWVVTPLAPRPENRTPDTVAAQLHAEHMVWVQGQLTTEDERRLFGDMVAAIRDGTYATSTELRGRAAKCFGYRREYEIMAAGGTPMPKVKKGTG